MQNRLGADIIMALDDVVPSTAADDARCALAAAAAARPQCGGRHEAAEEVSAQQYGSQVAHALPRGAAFTLSCCIFGCCCCCCCRRRRFEEATHRTTRWIDRCIAAHSRPQEQNLFAIVQVREAGRGPC